MYYNFCRVHQTLRVTPAMEAGVTDHVWDIEDIINLVKTDTYNDKVDNRPPKGLQSS